MNDTVGNQLGNVFGSDMWAKLASNPRLSKYLADQSVVSKLQEIQKNPKNVGQYMQDPAIMQIMLGLMGLDGGIATNPEEMEQMKAECEENLERKKTAEENKAPTSNVKEEVEEVKKERTIRDQSDELKQKGTEYYKKRDFPRALQYYDEAYQIDPTNVAVLTNKSAVLFEMEKYDECIEVSEKAVEEGRSYRSDFKIIARYNISLK